VLGNNAETRGVTSYFPLQSFVPLRNKKEEAKIGFIAARSMHIATTRASLQVPTCLYTTNGAYIQDGPKDKRVIKSPEGEKGELKARIRRWVDKRGVRWLRGNLVLAFDWRHHVSMTTFIGWTACREGVPPRIK
jgi:hypothetical protein